MLLFLLVGCPEAKLDDTASDWVPDAASNLCGTIVRPADAPDETSIWVVEVLDGQTACVGGDTGGSGWWGDVIAEPEADGDHFEATVPVGTYGVEVSAGMYSGCVGAEVLDETTCVADVLVELGYQVPVDKPNVYLYPTEKADIAVSIPAWRKITESEPRYPLGGWRVTAFPDGRLATKAGPRDFLFYELLFDIERFQTEAGWCVPGKLAQPTIEDAMVDLGFLPNEVADFADAWDDSFPEAEFMTIYPQVEDLSVLRIDPAPDHLLRAWFLVEDGCAAVVPPQLEAVPRVGYHAAEWGIAFRAPLDRGEIVVEGWR
ncbi:MAG: hypothetical protein Q8P18_08870 [Pseudomonadota bacterium]|nr:hypothetical protein [Pseudomonadota bacterium]